MFDSQITFYIKILIIAALFLWGIYRIVKNDTFTLVINRNYQNPLTLPPIASIISGILAICLGGYFILQFSAPGIFGF